MKYADARLILAALEQSKPKADQYEEPRERHANAIRAVIKMLYEFDDDMKLAEIRLRVNGLACPL